MDQRKWTEALPRVPGGYDPVKSTAHLCIGKTTMSQIFSWRHCICHNQPSLRWTPYPLFHAFDHTFPRIGLAIRPWLIHPASFLATRILFCRCRCCGWEPIHCTPLMSGEAPVCLPGCGIPSFIKLSSWEVLNKCRNF